MTRARILVLFAALASLACSGTETGNPPKPSVSFGLRSTAPDLFTLGTPGDGIEIQKTRIALQQLAFTACSDQAVTPVVLDTAIDLLDSERSFETPDQPTCFIELTLAPSDIGWDTVHAGSSSDLSLGISGRTTSSAPLFIEDTATPRVVFRPTALELSPGTRLSLSLDVATALSFEELEQAAPDATGSVVINAELNPGVLANVRQRWAASWQLLVVKGDRVELVMTGEAQ